MKLWLVFFFLLFFNHAFAQSHKVSFSTIDWNVQDITAPTPDSLSSLLTSPYTTGLEKVRAIYSWIVQHISYNMGINKPKPASFSYMADPSDTAAVWKSGDEMTAQRVLYRRIAVCEGYSRLFKVLCNYAGIEAEVITGYGRGDWRAAEKFRTNHTWNAVKTDSTWRLLDVTWASGYIDFANEYIAKQNDAYFFTPPGQFIKDHYPEELRWTLLDQPPAFPEFKKTPFRSKNFIKYGITSYFPKSGIAEASVGDTLSFSIILKDSKKAKSISPDPFFDSTTMSLSPYSRFIKPDLEKGVEIHYNYIVDSTAEWVHLIYNDDVIMRYRIILKNSMASTENQYR